MVGIEAKAELLRRRVAALSLPEGTLEEAAEVLASAGVTLPGMAEELRREWLNDVVASVHPAEFRAAARDPRGCFLAWLRERAKNRFHVTWRAIDAVALRLGAETASRLALVIWPQEIAWAQRMRLSSNPATATKAAMFLREAEGAPARVFQKLSDLYADLAGKAGYWDSPAQEAAPEEIRFGEEEVDFNPLFLRYASRAYAEALHGMPRERLEMLAARAARDETRERAVITAGAAVRAARKFPMRRVASTIAAAKSMGIAPNALFFLENGFLALVEAGLEMVDPVARAPHSAFVAAIADPAARPRLLASAPEPEASDEEILWEVANLDRRWLSALPESFSRWDSGRVQRMQAWQADVVEGRREPPRDPVSDFGFYLLETEKP
mgnify:CR=1 FL=1